MNKNEEDPKKYPGVRLSIAALVLAGQLLALGGASAEPGLLVDSQVTIGDISITFH
ncbi:hypothetical protein [Kocuria rosea]|uniref:hypothetical protein n=1 Tax=Kocuria rosea TaxID=1275 RepID=UPI001364AD06|nr:hypothetical protein [Kocuria polaris]